MTCKYNQAVDCTAKTPRCERCGWSPEVERRRKLLLQKPKEQQFVRRSFVPGEQNIFIRKRGGGRV